MIAAGLVLAVLGLGFTAGGLTERFCPNALDKLGRRLVGPAWDKEKEEIRDEDRDQ